MIDDLHVSQYLQLPDRLLEEALAELGGPPGCDGGLVAAAVGAESAKRSSGHGRTEAA